MRIIVCMIGFFIFGVIYAEILNEFKLFDFRVNVYIFSGSLSLIFLFSELILPEAEDWIKKALESDERNGMKWYLAMDYGTYAEIYQRKGDTAKARENLSMAIEILKECGADGWVERFAKELATL